MRLKFTLLTMHDDKLCVKYIILKNLLGYFLIRQRICLNGICSSNEVKPINNCQLIIVLGLKGSDQSITIGMVEYDISI